jgi:hypothetical protein
MLIFILLFHLHLLVCIVFFHKPEIFSNPEIQLVLKRQEKMLSSFFLLPILKVSYLTLKVTNDVFSFFFWVLVCIYECFIGFNQIIFPSQILIFPERVSLLCNHCYSFKNWAVLIEVNPNQERRWGWILIFFFFLLFWICHNLSGWSLNKLLNLCGLYLVHLCKQSFGKDPCSSAVLWFLKCTIWLRYILHVIKICPYIQLSDF